MDQIFVDFEYYSWLVDLLLVIVVVVVVFVFVLLYNINNYSPMFCAILFSDLLTNGYNYNNDGDVGDSENK